MTAHGGAAGGTIRELVATLGFEFEEEKLEHFNGSLKSAFHLLKEFGEAIIESAIVESLYEIVEQVVEVGARVHQMSEQLGLSTEALQEFQFAASLTGVSAEEMSFALRHLQKNAYEATKGNKAAAAAFTAAGIEIRDANGQVKDGGSLMEDLADKLGKVENSTERVALAQQILGRSGATLLPLFAEGAKGIEEMRKQAHELGGVLDEELIHETHAAEQTMVRFKFALFGVKVAITRVLLPAFSWLGEKMQSAALDTAKMIGSSYVLQAALTVLGYVAASSLGKLLYAFRAPLLAMLQWVVIIGAIVVVLDDLYTLFEGGDSEIGAFIDSIFGPGSAQAAVAALKETVDGLQYVWNEQFIPAMERFGAAAKEAADAAQASFAQFFADAHEEFQWFEDIIERIADKVKAFFTNWYAGFKDIANTIDPVLRRLGIVNQDSDNHTTRNVDDEVKRGQDQRFKEMQDRLDAQGIFDPNDDVQRQRALAPNLTSVSIPRSAAGMTLNTVEQHNDVTVRIEDKSGEPKTMAKHAKEAVGDAMKETLRRAHEHVKQEAR